MVKRILAVSALGLSLGLAACDGGGQQEQAAEPVPAPPAQEQMQQPPPAAQTEPAEPAPPARTEPEPGEPAQPQTGQ